MPCSLSVLVHAAILVIVSVVVPSDGMLSDSQRWRGLSLPQ
jgi:hypothetical protein